MSEYIVNFGDDKSSAFARLAMAEVACHGAKLCEEIVRCRDCKHYGKPYECWLEVTEPDEFCSRGKRKDTP